MGTNNMLSQQDYPRTALPSSTCTTNIVCKIKSHTYLCSSNCGNSIKYLSLLVTLSATYDFRAPTLKKPDYSEY